MASFWNAVNKVIRQSDVLLVVMDSRLTTETKNAELENKIKKSGKPFLYVLTKCDLISQEEAEKLKRLVKPSVFVSSKEYHGIKMLREQIIIIGKKNYPKKESYTVGVLGYPNVGKSSLINAVNGRSSAGASSTSGYTKGLQRVKADNKISFLDSPGVIPYKEKDEIKHLVTGTLDYNKTKDPELVVHRLMEQFPGLIEKHYSLNNAGVEDKISEVANKYNMKKKGNTPDMERASRKILQDWQEGKIRTNS